MRICHFTEILTGGPATYLNNLLPVQIERYGRSAVFVAAPASQMHLLDVDGINLLPLEYSGRSPARLFGLRRQWRAALRAQDPFDIVHLHSTFAGLLGRSLAMPRATSIIYCAHGWAFTMRTARWKAWLFALAERVLATRADALVSISESEHDAALRAGMPAEKCALVLSGIALRPALPAVEPRGDGLVRLLFVGRFDRQKGFDLLLEAMASQAEGRVRLTVIGGNVIDAARPFEAPSGVEVLGWQPPGAVREAIRASDAVIMPSRWEGFGLVALEAMRESRAVLAARVGGLAEIVVDGETGLLFAPDSATAVAQAVAQSASADLRQLGRNGRKRFEALFTADRMAAELDAIYRKCRAARHPRATGSA